MRKLVPTDTSGIANTAGIMTTGAVALTAVALLSGPAFVVPDLRAGAALLAMSVGGGVLSISVLECRDCQARSGARGHFHESGAGCFDGDCSLLRRTTKPRAVARWRAGDRRGDILSAVTWERRGGYDRESSRSRAATRWDFAPSTRRKTLPKRDWCSNACDRRSLERACGAAQPVRRIRRQVNASTEAPRSPR